MKRLALIVAIVLGLVVVSSVAMGEGQSNAAGGPWTTNGVLLNCADVGGTVQGDFPGDEPDGVVSIPGDILKTATKFGEKYGSPGYSLIYDKYLGDGAVVIQDILGVAADFGPCPLHDTQVARATLAMTGTYGGADLRDWSQAQAAGYVQSTQYVGQMGIHVWNTAYQAQYTEMDASVCDPRSAQTYDDTVCQLEHPVGLVYTNAGGQSPGTLIGAWYLVPNDEVCLEFGATPPCQGLFTEPVGFGLTNTDEDNNDFNASNQGWHDHQALCVGNVGTTSAWTYELHIGGNPGDATPAEEADCEDADGWSHIVSSWTCDLTPCQFFYTYGWMMHLYNFIPNPVGRFMQWNSNL